MFGNCEAASRARRKRRGQQISAGSVAIKPIALQCQEHHGRWQLARSPAGEKEDSAALKGDLSEIGLLDIIQILDNAQKNGQLSINSEGHTGTVFFNSGRIVNAVYKDKVGEPAMFALVAVKGGSFEFKPASFAFDVVINNSNTNLLLEGLRLLDEANRDQWEAEPSLEEDATAPPPREPTGVQSLETDSGLRPVADITTFPPPPSVDENNPLEDF